MPDLVVDLFDPSKAPLSAYLVAVTTTVTVGGSTVTSTPVTGQRRRFSIASTATELTLTVSVTPAGGSKLDVVQGLAISGMSLNPISSNLPKATLHPRIAFGPQGKNQFSLVRVDLTFVDVTDAATKQGLLSQYTKDWPNFPVKGGTTTIAPSGEPEPKDPHHQCELRILELTAGQPKAWAVVIPAAAKKATGSFNVITFFPPALAGPYESALQIGNVSPYEAPVLPRYTKDPPTWRPYRFRPPLLDTNEPQFDPWGDGGFEGQIAQSAKPVLFVIPLPQGEATADKRATDPGLTPLLGSLLVALCADGHIGSPTSGATINRLALAGYSAGGTPMLTAFSNNAESSSELYFFDITAPLPVDAIEKWFKRQKKRMVRMIAGGYLTVDDAKALRDQLSSSDRAQDVSFTPDNVSFFDTPGNTYHQSLLPSSVEASNKLMLSGKTSPSALSKATQLFITNATMGSVVLRAENLNSERKIPVGSATEVSSLIAARWGDAEVRTKKDFDKIINLLTPPPDKGAAQPPPFKGLRHQWPICGGAGKLKRYPYGVQKDATDVTVFEGYLLFCLKNSGFV